MPIGVGREKRQDSGVFWFVSRLQYRMRLKLDCAWERRATRRQRPTAALAVLNQSVQGSLAEGHRCRDGVAGRMDDLFQRLCSRLCWRVVLLTRSRHSSLVTHLAVPLRNLYRSINHVSASQKS